MSSRVTRRVWETWKSAVLWNATNVDEATRRWEGSRLVGAATAVDGDGDGDEGPQPFRLGAEEENGEIP